MPSEITNKYKETSEKIERIEKAIRCVLDKIGILRISLSDLRI